MNQGRHDELTCTSDAQGCPRSATCSPVALNSHSRAAVPSSQSTFTPAGAADRRRFAGPGPDDSSADCLSARRPTEADAAVVVRDVDAALGAGAGAGAYEASAPSWTSELSAGCFCSRRLMTRHVWLPCAVTALVRAVDVSAVAGFREVSFGRVLEGALAPPFPVRVFSAS